MTTIEDLENRIRYLESELSRHRGSQAGASSNLPHSNMSAINQGAYTITNGSVDRAYDASASSTNELANVLYTLIQDLKLLGIVG